MKFLRFAVAIAVLGMAISIPRLVLAQQACIMSSDCGPTKACVGGACYDPIYCSDDKDCGKLSCNKALHGCICENDTDCGTSGTCVSDKICKPLNSSGQCTRNCLENGECGDGQSCTFETTYIDEIGLCCPRIAGTPEEPFSCQVDWSGSDERNQWLLAGLLLACAFKGRIRRRTAG